MEDWKFWLALVVPGLMALAALCLAIRDSRRIGSIEEEIRDDVDLYISWQQPDEHGNTTCTMSAMGDNLTDVRIILPGEIREIGLLERHESRLEQFESIACGTQYQIKFKDQATREEHTKKCIIRFQ